MHKAVSRFKYGWYILADNKKKEGRENSHYSALQASHISNQCRIYYTAAVISKPGKRSHIGKFFSVFARNRSRYRLLK